MKLTVSDCRMTEPVVKKKKVTTLSLMIPDQTLIKRRWIGEEELRLYDEADRNILAAIQGNQCFFHFIL